MRRLELALRLLIPLHSWRVGVGYAETNELRARGLLGPLGRPCSIGYVQLLFVRLELYVGEH
jgi:hypothetical protein